MKAYFGVVLAVAGKNAALERRSLETVVAVVSFALLVAVMFYFGFDIQGGEGSRFFPGALWVALLFSGTVGFARTARNDELDGRAKGLAMAPVDRSALFFGKFLFHLGLMFAIELVTAPIFWAIFSPGTLERPWLFALGLFMGTWGFAALGTLLSGAAGGERGTGLLLPIVLFPLLVPVLLAGVAIAEAAVTGELDGSVWAWARMLAVFDVLFTAIPALFYEYILEV